MQILCNCNDNDIQKAMQLHLNGAKTMQLQCKQLPI